MVLKHNTLSQKIRIRPPAHGSPIRMRCGLHFGCRWACRTGRGCNGWRRAYSILCRSACWLPWRRSCGCKNFCAILWRGVFNRQTCPISCFKCPVVCSVFQFNQDVFPGKWCQVKRYHRPVAPGQCFVNRNDFLHRTVDTEHQFPIEARMITDNRSRKSRVCVFFLSSPPKLLTCLGG